jgi:hypothetical protein
VRQVEIPLTFDAEFFDILQGDVTTLDKLQEEEHEIMVQEIEALSTELITLAKYDILLFLCHLYNGIVCPRLLKLPKLTC